MDPKQYLERVISRFKTSEICSALEKWGYLDKISIREIGLVKSKQEMIRDACEKCKEIEIDMEAVGELEILYTHLHSKVKTWSVYEMTETKEEQIRSVNPTAVLRKMARGLSHYFETDVSVRVLDKAIWLRVGLSQLITRARGRLNTTSDVVYIVHYPRTNFVVATPIKMSFKENVFECLLSTLGYNSIKEMNLKGHCLQSLSEIVMCRTCQGDFRKHKPDEDQGNPLTLHPRRKRKEKEEEFDERIVTEDSRKRQKTLESLEKAFGPYVQPTLEKIEFKLETRFRGFNRIREKGAHQNLSKVENFLPLLEEEYNNNSNSKPFRCRVKFEGSNVLEGLRNLGKKGIASVPLPKHLTSIPSQARNYIVLGEKERSGRGLRSPAPA